jgi:hypothetical protein
MKIKRIFFFSGLLFTLIILHCISSCTHNADLANIPEICFERDVLPIILNNCAITGCHDGTGESEHIYDSYTSIAHHTEPGKPYSSEIYKAIISTWGEEKMPPDKPLTLENRLFIRLWIEQGARETLCPDIPKKGTGYSNPLTGNLSDFYPTAIK